MMVVLIAWVVISLLIVSFLPFFPYWALAGALLGGLGLGVYSVGRYAFPRGDEGEAPGLEAAPFNWRLGFALVLIAVLESAHWLPLGVPLGGLVVALLFLGKRHLLLSRGACATPLDGAILVLLLSAGLGLWASVHFQVSVQGLSQEIAGVVLFYLLLDWLDSEAKLGHACVVFVGVGVLVALAAPLLMRLPPAKLPLVSQAYAFLPEWLPRKVHSNYIGGILLCVLPVACTAYKANAKRKAWWMGACIILGLGILLTQSRGALLGTLVGVGVMVAWDNKRIRMGVLVGMGLGLAAAWYIYSGLSYGDALHTTLAGRLEVWDRAVHIISDFPFSGIGMQTFSYVVAEFYPLYLATEKAGIPHSHNFFLQVGVDNGIPGLVALGALLGAWGRMVWDGLQQTVQLKLRLMVLGLGGGLIAHLVYGLNDAIALGEKARLFFWALLALSTAAVRQARAEGWPPR